MKLFVQEPEKSIREYLDEARKRQGSVILDVRSPGEYEEGHIEGSINFPINEFKKIETVIPDKSASVYVYCLSGARSRRAAALLGHLGYTRVTDMGGIHRQEIELIR